MNKELTVRQLQILERLAKGMSTREIADDLKVKTGTITGHLQRIFHRLGVGNRVQALRMATRLGLIKMTW